MAGSDRSKVRDNPWDPLAGKGRWRVWNSRRGKPSWPAVTSRINRPDIWMQAIRSDLEKLLRHGGRPHMGPGSRPGRRRCVWSDFKQPIPSLRAKRSNPFLRVKKEWIASSQGLLAMTLMQFRILATRCVRAIEKIFALSKQRAQGMPDARCTRGLMRNV